MCIICCIYYSRTQSQPHPGYMFDESLLEATETTLMANELGLNDLTFEQLKTKYVKSKTETTCSFVQFWC